MEPFEHYCFIVEAATELIRRVCLSAPDCSVNV